mgnify:FL=1
MDIPLEYVERKAGWFSNRTKLKQIGDFERDHALTSYWSKWNQDAVEVKASAITPAITERYKMSLKRFQDWLKEPDTELNAGDLTAIEERYEDLKAGINIGLYDDWRRWKPLWVKDVEDMDDDELAEWELMEGISIEPS